MIIINNIYLTLLFKTMMEQTSNTYSVGSSSNSQTILGIFASNFERRVKQYFGEQVVDNNDEIILPFHIDIQPPVKVENYGAFDCGLPIHTSSDTIKCRDFNVDKVDLKNMKKRVDNSKMIYRNDNATASACVIKPLPDTVGAVDIYCDMV